MQNWAERFCVPFRQLQQHATPSQVAHSTSALQQNSWAHKVFQELTCQLSLTKGNTLCCCNKSFRSLSRNLCGTRVAKACLELGIKPPRTTRKTHVPTVSQEINRRSRNRRKKTRNHIRVGRNTTNLNVIVVNLIVLNFPWSHTVHGPHLMYRPSHFFVSHPLSILQSSSAASDLAHTSSWTWLPTCPTSLDHTVLRAFSHRPDHLTTKLPPANIFTQHMRTSHKRALCKRRKASTDREKPLWMLMVRLTGLPVSIFKKSAGRPQTRGLRRAGTSGTRETQAVIDCDYGRLISSWSAERAKIYRTVANYQE